MKDEPKEETRDMDNKTPEPLPEKEDQPISPANQERTEVQKILRPSTEERIE